MSLSSNSLIHLTKEKDALTGILTNNFKIKYCLEELLTQSGKLSYAVPMVSFCDIPMSEIKNHIAKYGAYGIGFTKEWGQRNQLNPVFYVDKNSSVGKAYFEAFDNLFRITNSRVNTLSETDAKLLDVFRYMKNFEGDLDRNGEIERDYRYADEREWRYVPSRDQTQMVYNKEVYLPRKDSINLKLNSLQLYFEPKDIKYIIIEHDKEITEFIRILQDAKSKYAYEDVQRLLTRIITVEQILNDF